MAITAAHLSVLLTAEDKASGAIDSLSSKVSGFGPIGAAAGLALGAVTVAGAGLAAGMAGAVGVAADFEKTMSGVGAVTWATQGEMAALSAKALQLGKDTAFGASEAAAGLGELAKGGVSVEDILGGAATAMTNLAAAGGIKLPQAAEVAANAMSLFGLKGKEVENVANKIAGAANASTIDVNDFALSMKAGGSVIKLAGGSFDDAALAITAMGKAGIKGSDAGTSLKTMYANLIPTTKQQIAVSRELGLLTEDGGNAFFDATGKVKSYAEIAGILEEAFKGLTKEQQLQKMETLFGSDAIRAAATTMELGTKGAEDLAAAMAKVTAEAVGRERMNNLAGSWEMFTGSIETAAIVMGSALTPALKGVVDGANALFDQAMPGIEAFAGGLLQTLSNIPENIQRGGIAWAAGGLGTDIARMLGLDEQAAQDIGQKAMDLVTAVQGAMTGIQTAIANVQIGFASGGLGGAVGTGAGMIAKMLGFTPEAATEISEAANNIVVQAQGALNSLAAIFAPGNNPLADLQLATIINENFGPDVSAVVTGFVQTVDTELSKVKPTLDGIKSAFQEGGLQGAIAAAFGQDTLDAMARFGEAVNTHVVPGLQMLGLAARDSASGMTATKDESNGVVQVLDLLTLAITNTGKAFEILGGLRDQVTIMLQAIGMDTDALGPKFFNLSNLATGGMLLISEVMRTALITVGKAAVIEFGTALDNLGALVGRVADIMVTNWAYGLMQMRNQAANAMTLLGQVIEGALNGIMGRVGAQGRSIGDNLVAGLVAGIQAGAGPVGSAAIGLVQTAISAMAGSQGLDARSPSRVTYQYGQWFVDGLATGITDRQDKAMLAAQELAKNTAAAFKTGLEGELATLRFNAEDIKFAFEDLIEPLQRQYDLIMATNDLTNERLGLENQIAMAAIDAEMRAAKGDPMVLAGMTAREAALRFEEQGLQLKKEEERINKRIAEGKATPLELEQLRINKEQLAIAQEKYAMIDRETIARLTGEKEILKVAGDNLKIEEAKEKLQKQQLALPLRQQIMNLKNEQKDALDPLQDQIRIIERQIKLHDLQQKGWQGVQTEINGTAIAIGTIGGQILPGVVAGTTTVAEVAGTEFAAMFNRSITDDSISWKTLVSAWFGPNMVAQMENYFEVLGLDVSTAFVEAFKEVQPDSIAAGRVLADAFWEGWATEAPKNPFDFWTDIDASYWQEFKKTLPTLQPTSGPMPSQADILGWMNTGLNATYRTPDGPLGVDMGGGREQVALLDRAVALLEQIATTPVPAVIGASQFGAAVSDHARRSRFLG